MKGIHFKQNQAGLSTSITWFYDPCHRIGAFFTDERPVNGALSHARMRAGHQCYSHAFGKTAPQVYKIAQDPIMNQQKT